MPLVFCIMPPVFFITPSPPGYERDVDDHGRADKLSQSLVTDDMQALH